MVEEVPSRLVSLNPTMPAVVAFGNPLLDISVHLRDKEFLNKHGLEEDGEVELPYKKMQEILGYLPSDSEQRISAGGSAQNSMRILQWLFNNTLKKPCSVYCGGLGKDIRGTTIYNSEHQAAICQIIGHANIVFGNAREMEALAQLLNITYDNVTDIPFLLNSMKRITVNASSIINDDWLHHARIFVMTQGGSAPAITVWGKGQSVQVHPIKPRTPIIDTIGAGDSLVAGFLAGILAQWKPQHCLEYGCKVASFMITRHGVTLPPSVPTDLLLYNANM